MFSRRHFLVVLDGTHFSIVNTMIENCYYSQLLINAKDVHETHASKTS